MGSPSLFDRPGSSSFAAASDWVGGLVFGPTVVTLCVLAVALLGFAMLTGRLPVRRAGLVVLGCFVLLGAPTIVAGLPIDFWMQAADGPPPVSANSILYERPTLPPATYDPYAGASLRRE